MQFTRLLRQIFYLALGLLLLVGLSFPTTPLVHASGSLTSLSDSLSDQHISTTSSHAISFTTATTSTVESISFQFATTSTNNNKPTGLNLASATLASVDPAFGSGWSIDTSNASGGQLGITRGSGSINSGSAGTVTFDSITNSAVNACDTSPTLYDTCYVQVTTYSDASYGTVVDEGYATYNDYEDPNFTLEVKPVSNGVTHNLITTTDTSTATTIPFGIVQQNSVHYISQELDITTNAPHGFTVTAKLSNDLAGNYGSSVIDKFGATNASWTTPQYWSSPNGSLPNHDSGWFGANITDTSQTGWSSPNHLFGPLSTIPRKVASSSTSARSGVSFFVSYAFEVSTLQPADSYVSNIIYNVQATY